jgi:hypothetical protein
MIDDECRDHDLENVSRKIVMEEEGSIVEEEGDEVEEVADEQDLADVDEFGEKFWSQMFSILIQYKQLCGLTVENFQTSISPSGGILVSSGGHLHPRTPPNEAKNV